MPGGRPAGSATLKSRNIANKCTEEGLTPLEYMLKVMRDEDADRDRRDKMAAAAAPFMHPRLQATAQMTLPAEMLPKNESLERKEAARRMLFFIARAARENAVDATITKETRNAVNQS